MNLYITQNSYFFVHKYFNIFFDQSISKLIYVNENNGYLNKIIEIINIFGVINFIKIVAYEIFYFFILVKKVSNFDYINVSDLDLNSKLNEILLSSRYEKIISIGCPCKIDINLQSKFNIKILNLHGGILPFQRGKFSPIKSLQKEHLILGATLHQISDSFDSGKVLAQSCFEIKTKDKLYNYSEVLRVSSKLLEGD